jgi:hypothetical protein
MIGLKMNNKCNRFGSGLSNGHFQGKKIPPSSFFQKGNGGISN